jgi:hypothetical protein
MDKYSSLKLCNGLIQPLPFFTALSLKASPYRGLPLYQWEFHHTNFLCCNVNKSKMN